MTIACALVAGVIAAPFGAVCSTLCSPTQTTSWGTMMSRLWQSRFWIRQLWPSHDLRPPILLSENFVDIERVWLLVELTHSPTSEQLTAELDELLG